MKEASPARPRPWQRALLAVACATLGGTSPAFAASFEIAVSPSRFELSGKSAARIGQSLDIINVGRSATEVSVRTLDWRYSDEGGVSYVDELLPDSCRTWVTLERRTVRVGAGAKAPFRFQLDVPPDAPRRECRFMLAVEGIEPAYSPTIQGGGASLSLPVNGRIAVAVYLSVNGAEPKLSLTQVGMKQVNGRTAPTVTISNTGDAHGRMDGSLDAVDANGKVFELVPEGTPIMPGQTRTLPLTVRTEANQPPLTPAFPIKSSGTLDWEKGGFKVNAEFK